MKRSDFAGRLQSLRPHIRRILPHRLHHNAGHIGRWLVQAIERQAPCLPIGPPASLPVPPGTRKENMRGPIILINASLTAGGAERQIVNLFRGLSARGVQASLLTLHLNERPELSFFLNELRASGLEARNASPISDAAIYLRRACGAFAFEALWESLDWAPPDIRNDIVRLAAELHLNQPYVVHGWQDATGIIAAFAALAVGTPRIFVAGRNLHPEHFSHARPFMRNAYAYLAQRPEIVIINNSKAGARSYADWIGIEPASIRVVRNGVAVNALTRPGEAEIAAFRRSLGLPARASLVGGAFRLQAEKRPLLWLAAAEEVLRSRPDAHFLIIGDGTMRGPMRKAANRLGLGDKLTMAGNVGDVRHALAMLDVLLLTSSQEGTPNVVLEATCLGVPVVATDAGGTGEAILGGETGLLVRENMIPVGGLADALADAVLSVLNGAIPRPNVCRTGRQFVEVTFGLERMVDEMISLYAE